VVSGKTKRKKKNLSIFFLLFSPLSPAGRVEGWERGAGGVRARSSPR
jgi:hypothetical protein